MLHGWQHKVVAILLYHDCNKSVTSLIISTRLLQVVNSFVPNLLTTCNKPCEHNLLTACLQTCYKLWDFYVCRGPIIGRLKHSFQVYTRKDPQLVTNMQTVCSCLLMLVQTCYNLLVFYVCCGCQTTALDDMLWCHIASNQSSILFLIFSIILKGCGDIFRRSSSHVASIFIAKRSG